MQTDKLLQGWRILILGLPGSALRTHVESLGKTRDSLSVLKAMPGKLDIRQKTLT